MLRWQNGQILVILRKAGHCLKKIGYSQYFLNAGNVVSIYLEILKTKQCKQTTKNLRKLERY